MIDDLGTAECLPLQHLPQVRNQLPIVNLTEPLWILFELRKRFADLRTGAVEIPTAEVMHSDRGLNQPLIEQTQGTPSRAPEVFPGLVGLKISPGVEKKYSVPKKAVQVPFPLSY
jgi:hypothetical protein